MRSLDPSNYCGQESLRRNEIAIKVNKSPKCSIWKQSQKWQNDLCSFPRQTIQYYSNPSLCPNHNAEQAEGDWLYEDLQDLLELTQKRCLFHYRGLECKSRKSRNTWSNSKFGLGVQKSTVSTYLPGFLWPEREGALRLHFPGRPGGHLWPHVDGASLLSWDFIDFLYKPRNTSLFSSLLYFLIYNILNYLSFSKSIAIAYAVSLSGFPGSCRGWTLAHLERDRSWITQVMPAPLLGGDHLGSPWTLFWNL